MQVGLSVSRFSCYPIVRRWPNKRKSCEINTNPNSPEEARAELLLPTPITTTAERMAELGWCNGDLVTQLTAKDNFTGFGRYQWESEEGLWNGCGAWERQREEKSGHSAAVGRGKAGKSCF